MKSSLKRSLNGPSRSIPTPLKTETPDAVKAAVDRLLNTSTRPVDFHRRLVEILADRKFDPVEELVVMCQEEWLPPGATKKTWRLDASLRVKVMTELMQYLMPKLKAVEVSGKLDHSHTINIVRYGEDGTVKVEQSKPLDAPQAVDVGSVAIRGVAGEGGGEGKSSG